MLILLLCDICKFNCYWHTSQFHHLPSGPTHSLGALLEWPQSTHVSSMKAGSCPASLNSFKRLRYLKHTVYMPYLFFLQMGACDFIFCIHLSNFLQSPLSPFLTHGCSLQPCVRKCDKGLGSVFHVKLQLNIIMNIFV